MVGGTIAAPAVGVHTLVECLCVYADLYLERGGTLEQLARELARWPEVGPDEMVFRVVEPGAPLREERFDRGGVIKIGRLSSSHLQLFSEDIARMHAVIEDTGEIVIIDLGSRTGTLVNRRWTNKRTLAPGDEITLGAASLRIYFHD